MEKDSLIILVVVVGLVAVSALLCEMGVTGKAVGSDAKLYIIEAFKVKEQGKYLVDGDSFSLYDGVSKMLSDGSMLLHKATLSNGVRFELSGVCKNAYTIDATYHGTEPSGEELASFRVKINGKEKGQFFLKEGASKVLEDESTITLLYIHRGTPDDNVGAEFELVCN